MTIRELLIPIQPGGPAFQPSVSAGRSNPAFQPGHRSTTITTARSVGNGFSGIPQVGVAGVNCRTFNKKLPPRQPTQVLFISALLQCEHQGNCRTALITLGPNACNCLLTMGVFR